MEIFDIFDSTSRIRQKMAFNAKTRDRIYLKIQQLVKNGMTPIDAIQTIISQQEDRKGQQPLVSLLKRWHEKLLNGQKFASAIEDDVSASDRTLISAGEESGKIENAIENILFLNNSTKRMKSVIKGGLAYPALLFGIAIALLYFVSTQLVPVYAEFADPKTWEGAAYSLYVGSVFTIYILPFIIIGLFMLGAISVYSLPRWTGPIRQSFEKIIPYSIYKLYHGTSFIVALSSLIAEGTKSDMAIKIIAKDRSPWFQERMNAILDRMENGEKFAEAMFNSGYEFPDAEVVDDIRAFQDSKSFDVLLTNLAKDAIETSIRRISGIVQVLKIIGMVAFALVLVWYILGMFGMNSVVTNMANK